jgi:UDP-glucose 4-epimerase
MAISAKPVLPDLKAYRSKRAVVTGGLGFIGSSLAIRLLELGAHVSAVDNFLPDHGANWYNIEDVRGHPHLNVNLCDFGDKGAMTELCREADLVFHLAGQVSHVLSLKNPFPDIELNIYKTAVLMEILREQKNKPRVVYTGTRGQYGAAAKLPVSEDAPVNPRGLYELTNLTAEKMIQIYTQNQGVPSVCLRLTNIYGPRAQVKHPHFGVLNWFVRLATEGKPITIMGNGEIQRDFVHVDDCVDAILAAGVADKVDTGEAINVGSDQPSTFLEAAKILEQIAGAKIQFIEFSKERAAQEIGNFYSDISKARKLLGWEPTIKLADGLGRYHTWLKKNLAKYV